MCDDNSLEAVCPLKTTEETIAELRRENFRLRLKCYDYEKSQQRCANPHDADSSRLFSAEADNLALKEAINEKTSLIRSASKMMEVLKEENDALKNDLEECHEKMSRIEQVWQDKYETLYAELQRTKELYTMSERRCESLEDDASQFQIEFKNRIDKLESKVSESELRLTQKQRELELLQDEAESLRATPRSTGVDDAQVKTQDSLHHSCLQRVHDMSVVVLSLMKEITDAGLSFETVIPPGLLATDQTSFEMISRKPLKELGPTANCGVTIRNKNSALTSETLEPATMGQQSTESVAWLSERLNAARRLIRDLGDQKLQHDDLLLQVQSLKKELDEKESAIQHLQSDLIMKNAAKAADVTQHINTSVDQSGFLLESHSVANDRRTNNNTIDDNKHADRSSLIRRALLSASNSASSEQEDSLPTTSASQQCRRSNTFSLEVNQPEPQVFDSLTAQVNASEEPVRDAVALQVDLASVTSQLNRQIADYARLKKAYDILASTTNMGSLASESITSVDISRDLAHLSNSSSLVGSVGDLPTVSTPPRVSTSPIYEQEETDDVQRPADFQSHLSSPEMSYTTVDVEDGPIGILPGPMARLRLSSTLPLKSHGLSTSGILHQQNVQPQLNLSLPGILPEDSFHNAHLPHHTTPSEPDARIPLVEPQSITGLRNLYQLIHGLKVQLDGVRFTQHSFVEMVNRSLSTAGFNASIHTSPAKMSSFLQLSGHVDEVVGEHLTGFLPIALATADRPGQSTTAETHSQANATYGGTHTLLENLNSSLRAEFDAPPEEETDVSTTTSATYGLNKTVVDLQSYPDSPVPKGRGSKRDDPVVPTRKSALRHPISRLKRFNALASNSLCEGPVDRQEPGESTTVNHDNATQPLSVSFNLDDRSKARSTHAPGFGDVSMMEWQNQELFERLARATAKLRDALEECAEASSQLWTGDMSQCFAQSLLPEQLDEVHEFAGSPMVERNRNTAQTTAVAPTCVSQPTVELNTTGLPPDQSARFDRVDPNLASMDFAQLSADISLSQLYGSAWQAPESSFSEKVEVKSSTDTHTYVSKATSTQTFTDPLDLTVLYRYISLMTHALTVLHRVIHQAPNSLVSGDFVQESPTDSAWLSSWLESAMHWFHSYVDALGSSRRAQRSGTGDSTVTQSEREDVESLLECLERVFNARIEEWVTATKQGFDSWASLNTQNRDEVKKLTENLMEMKKGLEKSDEERAELQHQLEENDQIFKCIYSILGPSDSNSSDPVPLTVLVETMMSKLEEREEELSNLQDECANVKSALQSIGFESNSTTVQSLSEFVRSIHNDCSELFRAKHENQRTIELLVKFGFPTEASLSAAVQNLVSSWTEKHQALNVAQEQVNDLREQRTSSLNEQNRFKTDFTAVSDELTQANRRSQELRAELDDVLRSSISLDTHEALLQQMTEFEQDMARTKVVCHNLHSERERIHDILNTYALTNEDVDQLVDQIKSICVELSDHRQSLNGLQIDYTEKAKSNQLLNQQLSSIQVELNICSIELTGLREQQEASLKEHTSIEKQLNTALVEATAKCEDLSTTVESLHMECEKFSERVAELEAECDGLRASHAAKVESLEAASATATAHAERANELSEQLNSLRSEPCVVCLQRSDQVNAQTSTLSAMAQPFTGVDENEGDKEMVKPDATVRNSMRVRKYGELKAVAFEIKEKLIQRTDKLEAALTEVARLRSVIQQDKEHASRLSEEVEDLRKQALRKNRRLRELESELGRLKTSGVSKHNHPPSSAGNTDSSARPASEVEQIRGAQCRGSALSQLEQSMTTYIPTLLLNDPATPSIASVALGRDATVDLNSTSLLFAQSTHSISHEPTIGVMCNPNSKLDVDSGSCRRCEELQHIVVDLHNLSSELKQRVDVDLSEEQLFLDKLEHPSCQLAAPAIQSANCSLTNEIQEISVQASVLQSFSGSVEDMKINIQSLHHARSRLKHYANLMDQVCGDVLRRINAPDGVSIESAPRSIASLDEQTISVSQSVKSLEYIRHRLNTLFFNMDVKNNQSVNLIMTDLTAVIRTLRTTNQCASINDKENVAPTCASNSRQSDRPGVKPSVECQCGALDLAKRAERYKRRYGVLARELDSVTQELSHTSVVLSATRCNLERATGLSTANLGNRSKRNTSPSRPTRE